MSCCLIVAGGCDPGTGADDSAGKGGGTTGTARAGRGGADSTSVGGSAGDIEIGSRTSLPEAIPEGPRCAGWTEDAAFGQMPFPQGNNLTGVRGAWGRSDSDIYLVIGTGDGLGIAHGDGQQWIVDLLPSTCRNVATISGAETGDPWLLCGETSSYAYGIPSPLIHPVILRKDASTGTWAASALDYPIAFDLTVLGPDDALVAASPTNAMGDGVVARWSGGHWVPTPLPKTDIPYTVVSMSGGGGARVYAIGDSITQLDLGDSGAETRYGVSTKTEMLDTLLSFDGAEWTAIRMPPNTTFLHTSSGEYGSSVGLRAVVGSAEGGIYALAQSTEGLTGARLYRVSEDLSSWTLLSDVSYSQDRRSLLPIAGGGAATARTSAQGSYTSMLFAFPDDTTTSCLATWGYRTSAAIILMDPTSTVWSAPGASFVHVWVRYESLVDQSIETVVRHFLVPVP